MQRVELNRDYSVVFGSTEPGSSHAVECLDFCLNWKEMIYFPPGPGVVH